MIFSMVLTVKNRVQVSDMCGQSLACGVGSDWAGLQPMGDTHQPLGTAPPLLEVLGEGDL